MRTLGDWIGGAKRSLADIRQQFEDELHLTEIQQEVQESSVIKEIREASMSLSEVKPSTDESTDPRHWPGMPPDGPGG